MSLFDDCGFFEGDCEVLRVDCKCLLGCDCEVLEVVFFFLIRTGKRPSKPPRGRKTQGAEKRKTKQPKTREARKGKPQKRGGHKTTNQEGRKPRGAKAPTQAWKEEEIQTQDDIYQV